MRNLAPLSSCVPKLSFSELVTSSFGHSFRGRSLKSHLQVFDFLCLLCLYLYVRLFICNFQVKSEPFRVLLVFFNKHKVDIHYVFSTAGFLDYKKSSIGTKHILFRKIILPEQYTFLLSKRCVKLC